MSYAGSLRSCFSFLAFFFFLAVGCLSPVNESFSQEDVTVTTYYPSPFGVYNQLQANKLAVGDTDGDGALGAGDQPPVNGQLYAARSVIFKPQAAPPAFNAIRGELVFNGVDNLFYVFDGSVWVPLGQPILTGTIDIPATGINESGNSVQFTAPVPGAAIGDVVVIGLPSNYASGSCGGYIARVISSDLIGVYFSNVMGGTDCVVPAGTYTIKVIKK